MPLQGLFEIRGRDAAKMVIFENRSAVNFWFMSTGSQKSAVCQAVMV